MLFSPVLTKGLSVLYADIKQSTHCATDFQQRIVVKVMKCFLRCSSLLIARNKGEVTSFDGNRVMGIFIGQDQENRAVRTGFQINTMISDILSPRLNEYTNNSIESPYSIDHCVGIDRGDFLALGANRPHSNELIWIGQTPGLAAQLSSIRDKRFKTVITSPVYEAVDHKQIHVKDSNSGIWQQKTFDYIEQTLNVYGSNAQGVFEHSTEITSARE